MKHIATLGLSLAFAIGLAAVAAAQTTSSSAGNLTTASPTTTTSSSSVTSSATTSTVKQKPPTSATADMVNEAIQRSQARAAKEAQTGTPQQWGSEEPFTYDPKVKNFTASQQ